MSNLLYQSCFGRSDSVTLTDEAELPRRGCPPERAERAPLFAMRFFLTSSNNPTPSWASRPLGVVLRSLPHRRDFQGRVGRWNRRVMVSAGYLWQAKALGMPKLGRLRLSSSRETILPYYEKQPPACNRHAHVLDGKGTTDNHLWGCASAMDQDKWWFLEIQAR